MIVTLSAYFWFLKLSGVLKTDTAVHRGSLIIEEEDLFVGFGCLVSVDGEQTYP